MAVVLHGDRDLLNFRLDMKVDQVDPGKAAFLSDFEHAVSVDTLTIELSWLIICSLYQGFKMKLYKMMNI